MKIEHLIWKCYFCGATGEPFDTRDRSCTCPEFNRLCIPSNDYFVARLPELPYFDQHLFPSLEEQHAEFFAVSALANDTERQHPFPAHHWYGESPMMPYRTNHLYKVLHSRCGNALLRKIRGLGAALPFRDIYVCDMAGYSITNTLKDPRSWAIMNVALEHGIRHIAVWTAGNAGLSLAKLAYQSRSRLADHAINVYCIVPRSQVEEVAPKLAAFGAIVIPCDRDPGAIHPDEIVEWVAAEAPAGQFDEDEYWDVTDGWDGIGVHMYRLLGAQLALYHRPRYILAPLGTGDLFIGLALGMLDAEKQSSMKLIGVAPAGQSSISFAEKRQLVGRRKVFHAEGLDTRDTCARKLEGYYSALHPYIVWALNQPWAHGIVVGRTQIENAASSLVDMAPSNPIACEPSALVGFAALPALGQLAKEWEGHTSDDFAFSTESRVLVISTGCGMMDSAESSLLASVRMQSVASAV